MKKFLLALVLCISSFGSASAGAETPRLSSSQSEAQCKTAVDRCAPPPQPLPCPPGKHWSLEGTGIAHCVADDPVCPVGTTLVRDAMGNPSCKLNPPPTCGSGARWTGSVCQMMCPSPQRWDEATGSCLCPDGQYWSNMASTCVNSPVCPQGQKYDSNSAQCIPEGASCPYGGPQNYPTCACPAGTAWTGAVCQSQSSCPTGQTWTGSSCVTVCAAGETWTGAGCVATNPTCPAGQVWNGSVCYTPVQNCPAGQAWNGVQCVSTAPSCPAGQTWNGAACVAPVQVCPAGQTWDGSACVSTQTYACPAGGPQNYPTCACPAGQTWDGFACTPPQNYSCPAGGPQNYPTCACPAGQVWNGSACAPPQSYVCPAGGPQNYPTCACPAGQVWSGSTCQGQSKPRMLICGNVSQYQLSALTNYSVTTVSSDYVELFDPLTSYANYDGGTHKWGFYPQDPTKYQCYLEGH